MNRWHYLALLFCAAVAVPALVVLAQDRLPVGKPATTPDDLKLVQELRDARRDYQRSLEALRDHYQKNGDLERMHWCEEELMSYHRIGKREYRLDLDVPPPTLQAAYKIPEANELYRKAMSYKGKGWLSEADDNLRRAELLFQKLLETYPQSDKIDETAYQLGEIYESRVFQQYRRSAMYYERVCDWNPHTDTDACLRAARLYDKKLHDRSRAIQLYRQVATHSADQKRVDEAKRRLTDLSAAPP
jgi:TolA-binding protein